MIPVPGDVTDAVHRDALIAAAERAGGLDLLVNNASTLGPSPHAEARRLPRSRRIGDVFRTNAGAPLALIQVALPLLRASTAPAIVNVTSDAAHGAYEGWGVYGASKAALEQLEPRSGGRGARLRVWSFDPGDMRTQMHQDAFPGEDISDRPLPEEVAVPSFARLLRERPASGLVRADDARGGRVMAARLAASTCRPRSRRSEPPEARRLSRDGVRMMVAHRDHAASSIHARFRDLPDFLNPGDLVVINTSGVLAAAVNGVTPSGERIVVHLSTRLTTGRGSSSSVTSTATQLSAGATTPCRRMSRWARAPRSR